MFQVVSKASRILLPPEDSDAVEDGETGSIISDWRDGAVGGWDRGVVFEDLNVSAGANWELLSCDSIR